MRRRRRRTRTTRRRGRRRSETALRWPPRRFGLPQTSMVVRQPTLRCSVGVAMSCGGTNPPAQPARVSQLCICLVARRDACGAVTTSGRAFESRRCHATKPRSSLFPLSSVAYVRDISLHVSCERRRVSATLDDAPACTV